MNMIKITSILAVCMALPQFASGAIVLAGWHEFTLNTSTTKAANSPANEGVAGIYNSPDTNLSHKQTTTAPGGSIDGWYGPDSVALGGVRTNQVIANTALIPGYVPETAGPGPRLLSTFTDTADYSGLPSNTNFDGRIANMNGTDITITNDSQTSYSLQSLVFDAFVGDTSTAGSADLRAFTFTVTVNGVPVTTTALPNYGVAGLNSTAGYGPVNTVFPGPTGVVPNLIDYGTGTNYVDYVIDLSSFKFAPGESFTVGFASVGEGTIRLDNIALLAVPEPGSLMAVVGLVGSGCVFRRRKKS